MLRLQVTQAVRVIAEAGVNHNGSIGRALALVDAAADAGADIVKFQTFRASHVARSGAATAAYQARATGLSSQLELLSGLELDVAAHRRLIAHCSARGIGFLSTPFDLASLAMLIDDLHVEALKLSSGDLTNGPLLLAAAQSGRAVILSTGMAYLGEIEAALGVLAFGYTAAGASPPTPRAFEDAYLSDAGRRALAERVTLLHCTTEYPASFESVNLRAMDTLRDAFGLSVGLSDHTPGIAVALAGVARGARLIEKHLTLDRSLPGPDQQASLEPGELRTLVAGVRAIEAALGDGIKRPAAAELMNRTVARRSLVAARAIRAGELFGPDNLAVKRPGDGQSPMAYWRLLGRPARHDYEADEAIDEPDAREWT
jgi:N-acetylneuraminate synthase